MDIKINSVPLFGPDFQFKDTRYCNELVNKYFCHAWGSRDNTCAKAVLPPCRSLCVQVADLCVFMHLYRAFLDNVCQAIPCDSNTSEEKESKPQECVAGELEEIKGADRCSIHTYVAPEGVFSSAPRLLRSFFLLGLAWVMLGSWEVFP